MAWDFWTQHTESFHQTTFLFTDRGTPYGLRHMNGYSSHAYKWVNSRGEEFYVQYTFKPEAGIRNFTDSEAAEMAKTNPLFSRQDLWETIEAGTAVTWTMYYQVMPVAAADTYEWDVFDITKVWPHGDYPLIEVGKLVLNRNPENWFAEVEQAAFSPSNLVPGIEATPDKML
jgi:catalase